MAAGRIARVYVETTVWNFMFSDDAPEHEAATRQFFAEVGRGSFDVYIGKLVLDEIQAAPEPRRSQLLNLINEVSPAVLEASDESDAMAAQLVAAGMVPSKYPATPSMLRWRLSRTWTCC